ncbi:MAG: anti-sigma F factor [Clostridia bacterium]|nr:anti-sigma F factor [Clostridia bacterium]
MEAINKFSMSVLSRSANEGFARASVASFAAQLDPTLEEISDIKTAVSEAVTNCIVHAYKDSIGKIYINSEIYDNGVLKIKIRDKGCGIENVEKAMEPLFTTVGGERAGLGFAVMQSFMDTVKVRSKTGVGTTVIMSKRISPRYTVNGRE